MRMGEILSELLRMGEEAQKMLREQEKAMNGTWKEVLYQDIPPEEEQSDTSVLMIKIDADTTAFNEKIDALMARLHDLDELWQKLNKGE
jgi:hypothetical protein